MAKSKLSVVRAAVDDVIGAALDRHPAPEPIVNAWDTLYVNDLITTLRVHGWTVEQWNRAAEAQRVTHASH